MHSIKEREKMGLLNCVVYLIIVGIITFIGGRIFPRKWIKENKFPFESFKFEKNGKIYDKIKIKKWKTKLPDASCVLYKIMPKKRIETKSIKKIEILVKESCIAEATHVIVGVLSWLCIYIWKKRNGFLVALLFNILNLPFILIQRYNRPRLKKVLKINSMSC